MTKTYLHLVRYGVYNGLHNTDLQIQKYSSLAFASFVIIFILLLSLLLISNALFHNSFAASPAFDQVMITDAPMSNQKNDWVQTYGNDSTHLKSDHANILTVDYDSDGKTLDATFWLASWVNSFVPNFLICCATSALIYPSR
jgi:hypothetical protein